MSYPRLEINLSKIIANTKKVTAECKNRGINVVGVTKVFCGHRRVAEALVAGGVDILADSRIENLKKLAGLSQKKMLIRIPMLSQINRAVKYSDISLVSDITTVKKLSHHAVKQNKIHNIILMIDLGDLREGIFYEEEIPCIIEEILRLEGVRLHGIGTNLSCFGGVMPTNENLSRLLRIKQEIQEAFNIDISVVSGGSSGSMSLFNNNEMPSGINQLRLGASLMLGIGLNDEPISGLYTDAVRLIAEIVEIKDKPSVPIGKVGLNAFGNKPAFVDKGIRRRAICAVGKQDVNPSHIIPYDLSIEVLGGSSDHLILDVTESNTSYKVGDKLSFRLAYGGCLSSMTSSYVYKSFIE